MDTSMIDFEDDEAIFPLNCNFKATKTGWKPKKIEIELFINKNGARNKVHKWGGIDLAQLERVDIVNQELEANASPFGDIKLDITLFRGKPSDLPYAQVVAPGRGMIKSRSDLVRDNVTPSEQPEHGLASLRRNMRRNTTKTFTTSPSAFTSNSPIDGPFAEELDAESQNLFEEEPHFIDGYPEYGLKVIEIFIKQPRGANFVTPVAMVSQTLCQKANASFEACQYAFYSMCYIYTELKYNGFPTSTQHIDLKVKMNYLFDRLVGNLVTIYGDAFEEDDKNVYDEIRKVFDQYTKTPFCQFCTQLILFSTAIRFSVIVGKKIIKEFYLQSAPFYDKSLDKVSDDKEVFMDTSDGLEFVHNQLLETPIPSLM